MQKIASFTVDHNKLVPGLYVSRIDESPDGKTTTTTFDIRLAKPNIEPVLNTAELHTLEHLGATFLRNDSEWKERIVYFGPMGCRTGFYLVVFGEVSPMEIAPLLDRMFSWAASYKGDIPGATAIECGNYLDQNLSVANWRARRYLDEV